MSATLSTIVQPSWTERLAPGLRIFNACREVIARYLVRRAAVAALRELDDRILRDMGIGRSEIEAAAHGLITPRART